MLVFPHPYFYTNVFIKDKAGGWRGVRTKEKKREITFYANTHHNTRANKFIIVHGAEIICQNRLS